MSSTLKEQRKRIQPYADAPRCKSYCREAEDPSQVYSSNEVVQSNGSCLDTVNATGDKHGGAKSTVCSNKLSESCDLKNSCSSQAQCFVNSRNDLLQSKSPDITSTFSEDASKEHRNEGTLHEQLQLLQQELSLKEEKLRKLNMVKMYRTKNDLKDLASLTLKWKGASQQVLIELHENLSEPKPTLTNLINSFQLQYDIIGYDAEDESFTND